MRWEFLDPWNPKPGDWDRASVLHVFRRAGFGAGTEEVERALGEGPEATLERLFEDRTSTTLLATIDPLLATGKIDHLRSWWMALILAGGAPLRERMTLLWHAHFATSNEKVDDVRMMHAQNRLLREQALGDFRELLRSVARDPAMLVWLDGDSNRSGHPNENFAREVMELFTLGIGNYDESDVRDAARAFSGWGVDGRSAIYRPEHHDGGRKTLFGRTGDLDANDALELLLEHPACARRIAWLLLRAFVTPQVREEWIEGLARVLAQEEWNLERTLRILLRSRLFHSPAARRARIAAPVELVAVAARSLEVKPAPAEAARLAATMGQSLFCPPSVKGWSEGRSWIHSGSWIARQNALAALAAAVNDDSGLGIEARNRSELTRRVLTGLLPEEVDSKFERELERSVSAAATLADARRAALALVVTSPEFQVF